MTAKKTTKKKQFKDFKPAKPVKVNFSTGKKPEIKKPDKRQVLIFVRQKTLADREDRLIFFAAGLVWGLVVAQIMRKYYGKEKNEKEKTQAAVSRE